MTAKQFCDSFNCRATELKLQDSMEVKEVLSDKVMFNINKGVAGFFWTDNNDVTGISIIMSQGDNHLCTLILLAVIVDVLTGLSQVERNSVFRCLGFNNGTWVKGKRQVYKGYYYKANKTKAMATFDVRKMGNKEL